MKFSTLKSSLTLSVCSVLLVAACGGGGSSEGGNSTTASTVNFNNAKDVAAQAYAASESVSAQSGASGELAGSLVTGVTLHSGRSGVIGTSLRQLYRGLDAQTAGNLVTGVETTEACTNGGTISVSATVANEGQVSNGDSLSITTNGCVEGDVKLNGGIRFTFSNLTGTIGPDTTWSATLAIVYSNLTTEVNGEVLRVNGDLTVGYVQTNSLIAKASASSSSLQVTYTSNGETIVDYTLSSLNCEATINSSSYTHRADYTVSGKLGNLGNTSYTVTTNTRFEGNAGAFPSKGSMTVKATDNTSLTLTAVDSTNVRIDLDTNGDGGIDQTINTTWDDLASRV